jgi:membrane associated rhomboid family serine protease
LKIVNISEDSEEKKLERLRIFHTFFFPGIFVFLMWMVHLSFLALEVNDAYKFGVFPQSLKGLRGIFLYPLIHGGWGHLFSNSIPILVLGAGLFYFYKVIAYRSFFGIYLLSGILLWIIGRASYHVGASGIVYGLVAFLFISGLLRKQSNLMAFSLFVVFLYGSLVWGLLPIDPAVSFEGHLAGGLAGTFFAWLYRKEGPQAKPFQWEEEPEEELDNPDDEWMKIQQQVLTNNPETEVQQPEDVKPPPTPQIKFIYTEKKPPSENL